MNTVERPSFGDETTEMLPWVAAVVVLAPIAVLSLMLWAPFLILLALALTVTAGVGVVAAAGALLASPYLLLRHRRRRQAARDDSAERQIAISGVLAQAGGIQ